MDEFGDLTKPGRLYFLNSRICVCYKKSHWRASVNEPKKAMKNSTNYFVTSFYLQYKRSSLQWPQILGRCGRRGGGGAGVFGELCVPPEESWLRPWFNQPFGEELSSYSSTVFFVFTAVIFIWVSSLRKQPFLLVPRRWGRFARRIVCDSATEIPYWWRKIYPESGHKRWLDDGVVTSKQ